MNSYLKLFYKPTPKPGLLSNNKDMDIIIIICIILFLGFVGVIVYNNRFRNKEEQKNKEQIPEYNKMLKPLKQCSTDRKYRLVDYYVASSYNTPSLSGKESYNYVSTDAIKNTLLQGARFIQFKICSLDVDINNKNDEPVVGNANKFHITSLNTLPLKQVLLIIKDFAFKLKDIKGYKKINYPLFIEIGINTNNITVLNKAYKYIKEYLGDFILDKAKYQEFPIQFEYLCELLNKIVIFVDNKFNIQSDIDLLAIPKNSLIQKLNISQISKSIITQAQMQNYIKALSEINLSELYKNKDIFSVIIDKVKENNGKVNNKGKSEKPLLNIEYDEDSVMNKLDLEHKLPLFNAIGLTFIQPDENNFDNTNYNIKLPINTGCQFNLMFYQNNDEQLEKYKKLFAESSFILKPGNIRIPEIEEDDKIDLLEKYGKIVRNTNPLNYHINFYDYNYGIIYLQEIVSGDFKYSYINERNELRLTNNPKIIDGDNRKNRFLLTKQVKYNDISAVYILNPNDRNYCLTVNENFQNNGVNLSFDLINNTQDDKQLFVIEKGLIADEEVYSGQKEEYISIRSVLNTDTPYYLSVYKNSIQLKNKNTITDKKRLTFNSKNIPAKFYVKFKNLVYGNVKAYNTVLGIGKDADQFEIEYDTNSDIYIKYLDSYVCLVENNTDVRLSLGSKCKFEFKQVADDIYTIVKGNKYLIANKNGSMSFKEEFKLIQPAKRDELNRLIQQEQRGPSLGSSKLFKVEFAINA